MIATLNQQISVTWSPTDGDTPIRILGRLESSGISNGEHVEIRLDKAEAQKVIDGLQRAINRCQ